jgi:hypothetical protein
MEIIGPQLPSQIDLLAKSPKSVVDAWKVGQILSATGVSSQKGGLTTINIGGALFQGQFRGQLPAQAQFPIKPGQPLQLEVSSLMAMTVLKIIDKAPRANTAVTITLQPQANLVNQLQPGQVLAAILNRTAAPMHASLELGGNRINVQLSQPLSLTSNQAVKLEVVTPGALAALRILNPTTSPSGINRAMRTTLPQQAPLPSLLANIALVANSPSATTMPGNPRLTLPQALVDAARQLVQQMPTTKSISSGDGLKQAVQQSGLFMEARLAQTLQTHQPTTSSITPNTLIDFKGGLLSLLVSLLTLTKGMPGSSTTTTPPPLSNAQTAPPPMPHTPLHAQASANPTLTQQMNLQQVLFELLRSVEGGLARLQLSQLVSSAPEEDGRRSWVLELPVRADEHIDLIQLRIDKQAKGQDKKKKAMWSVTLAFDLKGLGPVQARVSLANDIINTTFWAENEKTTHLIQEHLQTLRNRYRETGLNIGALNAHSGRAPHPTPADANLPQVLLDVQA